MGFQSMHLQEFGIVDCQHDDAFLVRENLHFKIRGTYLLRNQPLRLISQK